jgi:hypothetical protein
MTTGETRATYHTGRAPPWRRRSADSARRDIHSDIGAVPVGSGRRL